MALTKTGVYSSSPEISLAHHFSLLLVFTDSYCHLEYKMGNLNRVYIAVIGELRMS